MVYNAADSGNATRLALSVAVAQEVAMLLDAVDRLSLPLVDLSAWSRIRSVSEMWWLACGFRAEDLDLWFSHVQQEELAPGVPAKAGSGRAEVAVPGSAAIFQEDGGRALVEILQNLSDERWERVRLKVVRLFDQPIRGELWIVGSELSRHHQRGSHPRSWIIQRPVDEDLVDTEGGRP